MRKKEAQFLLFMGGLLFLGVILSGSGLFDYTGKEISVFFGTLLIIIVIFSIFYRALTSLK